MYPSTNPAPRWQRLLWILFLMVLVWGGYTCFSAIKTARHTGILVIQANDANASISISQEGKQAMIVGAGNARMHLKPGVYHIAASSNGKESTAVAEVRLKQSSKVVIDTSKTNALPSIQDIDFQNVDALINSGLSTTQINTLEQQFFQFDKTARTISISTSSVQPGPHNIDTDGGTFHINFQVLVGTTRYKATTAYSGLDTVQLFLFDYTTGAQVFVGGQ